MKLLLKKQPNLVIPSQANPGEDACYDVMATTDPVIIGTKIDRPIDGLSLWKQITFIEYGTGLFVAPEEIRNSVVLPFTQQFHLKCFPRSSISKYNLALANSVGVIDSGYRAEIKVRFKYIFQPEDYVVIQEAGGTRIYGVVNQDKIYHKGDKIIQIEGALNQSISFETIDELPKSLRDTGGFGSSGV